MASARALLHRLLVMSRIHASILAAAVTLSMGSLARAKDVGSDAPPDASSAPSSAPNVGEAPRALVSPGQQKTDPWTEHPLALEAHTGAGTPVGYAGGVLEYGVSGAVGLGVGVGYGTGPYHGSHVHSAVLARFRPIRGPHNALSIGTAVSFGGFQFPYFTGDTTPIYSANWAVFAQADAGWEFRTSQGTLLRIALGVAMLLNGDSMSCSPGADGGACEAVGLKALPTLDLAFGQSF